MLLTICCATQHEVVSAEHMCDFYNHNLTTKSMNRCKFKYCTSGRCFQAAKHSTSGPSHALHINLLSCSGWHSSTRVWLCDLNNLLLSANNGGGTTLYHLLFPTSRLGLHHKLHKITNVIHKLQTNTCLMLKTKFNNVSNVSGMC